MVKYIGFIYSIGPINYQVLTMVPRITTNSTRSRIQLKTWKVCYQSDLKTKWTWQKCTYTIYTMYWYKIRHGPPHECTKYGTVPLMNVTAVYWLLYMLLRGTIIVNRTYGTDKNLYISLFLLLIAIFGPINYSPVIATPGPLSSFFVGSWWEPQPFVKNADDYVSAYFYNSGTAVVLRYTALDEVESPVITCGFRH